MGTDAAHHRPGEALRASAHRAGRALTPAWIVGLSLTGLLILGLIGWVAWTQGAVVGLRWVEFDAPLSLAALGFLAGAGAFFAPCAFALFPGYVSYYLAASGENSGIGRSLGLGLSCAAGSVLFFALVGIAITLIGGALSPYLIGTKPFVALAVVALGVVQFADIRMPSLALPLGGRGLPVAAAVFLYGFGYALASTGCTLPLYVSITVLPLTSGFSGAAILTFASFATAMALLMLLTTLLVGLAKQNLIRTLQSSTKWIKRASGVVLILAGLYLGYYYVRAGM
ncbi:MAG TPA: cytochrome c biogenesis protein CcdA [Methylomirabilota bacterium]|nr:cytochrome c biogenesis protein CcdA [Methylomirabilota bacterium]